MSQCNGPGLLSAPQIILIQACYEAVNFTLTVEFMIITRSLKVLAMIPYFNFHSFPHLLIFLQFRDPSYVLNLSTKAVLQK